MHAALQLPDGRKLAYSQVGSDAGRPVLYLHGNPGSRKEMLRPHYREAFHDAALRVITIDRPGYGESDPPLQKGHLPFVDDVCRLMDHLDLQRTVVVGHSRGTLPAIGLGVRLEARIGAVGAFGPTGLPDDPELMHSQSREARLMLHLVKSAPFLARKLFLLNSWLDARFPQSAATRMARFMSSATDRAQLRANGRDFVAALTEGMQRDPAFAIDDWRSWLVDPLGFEPSAIRVPLLLWIGSEDGLCPPAPVRRMAKRIAAARLRELPGVGHLHSPALLTQLMNATLDAALGHRKTR